MHHLAAFSPSVKVTEEVKDIVWRGCRPTTGCRRNDADERFKLVGYPTFRTCPGRPSIAAISGVAVPAASGRPR